MAAPSAGRLDLRHQVSMAKARPGRATGPRLPGLRKRVAARHTGRQAGGMPSEPVAVHSADPAHPADPSVAIDATFPACVPTLTDGVVTLRAHRPDDADRIVQQCQDPQSQAFLPIPSPYGTADAFAHLDEVAAAWEQPWGKRAWVITDDTGEFLGSVNLHERSPHRAEVGFGVHPDGRGHGLAARAVRIVAARAFAEGAEVVRWRAVHGNWASRRVAWACGFERPTTLVGGRLDRDGRPGDEWHAALRAGAAMVPNHPWLVAPDVEGERVRLREFAEEDAHWLPEQLDPRAARFLTRGMPTRQGYAAWLTEQRSRAADGDTVQWAVVDRHTDEVLGAIVLTELGHPRTQGTALLGFWLLPQWRGQGFMGEAIELTVATAFAPHGPDAGSVAGQDPNAAGHPVPGLGLRALRAVVDETNVESARVLRAAGFQDGGRERAAYSHDGEPPADCLLFDLLAADDREAQRVRPLVAPVIETARLRMRPWRDTDRPDPADDPDPAALRFMPSGAQPGHADFDAWLARKQRLADAAASLDWCIADRETDRALGSVGLFQRGTGAIDFDAEIGYWVFPSARGHGFIGEALPHVIDHAFRPRGEGGLGLTRVHAGADDDNAASIAVLRRAGLRVWGQDRDAYRRSDGTLTGGVYVELLATDPS